MACPEHSRKECWQYCLQVTKLKLHICDQLLSEDLLDGIYFENQGVGMHELFSRIFYLLRSTGTGDVFPLHSDQVKRKNACKIQYNVKNSAFWFVKFISCVLLFLDFGHLCPQPVIFNSKFEDLVPDLVPVIFNSKFEDPLIMHSIWGKGVSAATTYGGYPPYQINFFNFSPYDVRKKYNISHYPPY